MYSINQLARLSEVSSRTLRYYDQLGLLVPAQRTAAGVRMYEVKQVDQLQRILFFKTLNVPLKEIKDVMQQPVDRQIEQLLTQQSEIEVELQRLQNISTAITSSIKMLKGEETMSDTEKFKSFKQKAVAQNEVQFGNEIREKYGKETVEMANQQYLNLTEEQFEEAQKLEKDLMERLKTEMGQSPVSENRHQIFKDHQGWLKIMAGKNYSKTYHQNLALMYQADERFQKYYDDRTGCAGAGLLLSEIIAVECRN
jgi:DNA-binding transcriptional MerR regulator